MKLEDYFDFLAPDDIRVKGTRVGIETVLFDYLEDGATPEDIAMRYPTVTLEQVYATITYYWHKRPEVDAYLQACQEHEERMRREQRRHPPPAVKRLLKLLQQRQAALLVESETARMP
nr:DUF433 domain-containing protein [Anaerolineae bacterium]